jgi:hypothetical protein
LELDVFMCRPYVLDDFGLPYLDRLFHVPGFKRLAAPGDSSKLPGLHTSVYSSLQILDRLSSPGSKPGLIGSRGQPVLSPRPISDFAHTTPASHRPSATAF